MIRVLQIGLGPNPGGIENCIVGYHRFLNRNEVQFDYADIYGQGLAFQDEIEDMGGRIFLLPNYKKNPLGMKRGLTKLLKREQYDIIHINMLSAANMIPVTCACAACAHVIVHSHNTAVPSGFLRSMLNDRNLERLRGMGVSKWACGQRAGEWMWGEAFESKNVLPNAIDVTQFARNPDKRQEIRRRLGVADDEILFGMVGRLVEQKNPLFTVEIIDALRKEGVKARCVMIGDGDLRGEVEKKIGDLGLEEAITLTGVVPGAAAWYSAMDAFLLPSRFEGFPVVAVEAQAASLPCYISNNVSWECALTNQVRFISMREDPRFWAEIILADFPAKDMRDLSGARQVPEQSETPDGISSDGEALKEADRSQTELPAAYRFPEAAECLMEKYRRILEEES